MLDDTNPVKSANELAELVRSLAYATRSFGDKPGDTYWVLGSLLQANRRMMQVYAQVASAHINNRELAHTDDGNPITGRKHAHDAAMALRRAVFLAEKLDGELNAASQESGRIAWYGSTAAGRGDGVDVEGDGSVIELGLHRDVYGPGLSA